MYIYRYRVYDEGMKRRFQNIARGLRAYARNAVMPLCANRKMIHKDHCVSCSMWMYLCAIDLKINRYQSSDLLSIVHSF